MTNTTSTNPIDAIRESIERRQLAAAIISGVLSDPDTQQASIPLG